MTSAGITDTRINSPIAEIFLTEIVTCDSSFFVRISPMSPFMLKARSLTVPRVLPSGVIAFFPMTCSLEMNDNSETFTSCCYNNLALERLNESLGDQSMA